MSIRSICTFAFLIFSIVIFGQVKRVAVSGKIIDNTSTPIIGASVVLLNPVDSVMIAFGSSDIDGNFIIKNVKPQSVKLQITYIGYGTIEKVIDVPNTNAALDLGQITIYTNENLLNEVVVKSEYVPIKIKKDTVEYNADAFRVRPNANVEELLKKLPGIEVDANGTITAQGEEVTKVTVDGKKFFGNDPKMATQNLPADAVKKLQFIDKKSEKAQFSGISDGETEKVLNLQLKDDKKVGTFGDVMAGIGNKDRFDSKVALNKFNGNTQMSLLGNYNNLSNQGFSFQDYNTLMGGNAFGGNRNGGGGFSMPSTINTGSSLGKVKSATIGANFSHTFSPKYNMSASYLLSNSNQDLIKDKSTQNFNGNNNFLIDELSNALNLRNGHTINLNFQAKPDSFHRIDLESSIKLNNSNLGTELASESKNPFGDLVNSNNQKDSTITNLTDISIRGVLNKRLRKAGRNMTLDMSYGQTINDQDYDVQSFRNFVNRSKIDSLIQNQISKADNNNYRVNAEYKEPLGKQNYIGFAYQQRNYSSNQDKTFYDLDYITQLRTLNMSSFFRNDIIYNRASVNYTKDNELFAFIADLGFQRSVIKGKNEMVGNLESKPYNYFLPNLTFNWIDKNIRIRYNTSVNEPSVTQLQPILDNSNPLNLYQGNPDLKPEYSHSMNIRYNFFNNFNFVNFFTFINLRYTKDKIVTSQNINPDLSRISTPVNTNNSQNASINLTYSSPIRPLKIKTRVFGSGSINKAINFINSLENVVTTYTPRLGVDFENLNSNVVSLLVGYDLNYSQNKYSVSVNNNISYTIHTLRSNIVVNFGKGFVLDGDINHSIYSQEKFADKTTLTFANTALSKRLFNDRLTAKIRVADIFNVGQGINRNVSETYIESQTTNAIGRFAMLSLTYRLSAFNPQSNMPQGPMMRMMR